MKFVDKSFSRSDRYSLGIEKDSGKYYLSIPVSNHLVDYEEYYELSEDEFQLFERDGNSAKNFAEECRKRNHDSRLIQKPGTMRGAPR